MSISSHRAVTARRTRLVRTTWPRLDARRICALAFVSLIVCSTDRPIEWQVDVGQAHEETVPGGDSVSIPIVYTLDYWGDPDATCGYIGVNAISADFDPDIPPAELDLLDHIQFRLFGEFEDGDEAASCEGSLDCYGWVLPCAAFPCVGEVELIVSNLKRRSMDLKWEARAEFYSDNLHSCEPPPTLELEVGEPVLVE